MQGRHSLDPAVLSTAFIPIGSTGCRTGFKNESSNDLPLGTESAHDFPRPQCGPSPTEFGPGDSGPVLPLGEAAEAASSIPVEHWYHQLCQPAQPPPPFQASDSPSLKEVPASSKALSGKLRLESGAVFYKHSVCVRTILFTNCVLKTW